MILSDYKSFIDSIYKKLTELGVDTSALKIDHIGYQADSADDYDQQISDIKETAEQVSENIVGERRVGVFKLNSPVMYGKEAIPVIEIFEPVPGQSVKSAWEHVEFLVSTTLEEFMAQYPNIEWDSSKLNRDEFPMLILKLDGGLRAKFPRRGVLDEVKRQEHSNL